MNLPPRVFRSRVPAPDNVIVKSGIVDDLDEWSIADRYEIAKVMENYGKAYAQDWSLMMVFVVLIASLIGAIINFVAGYETDMYDVVWGLIFIPFVSLWLIRCATAHIVDQYRKALEEANNDY